MKLNSRCFPYGALAYDNLDSTVRMVAKLFEKTPYLPFLPNITPEDTILKRTLEHIPGVKLDGQKVMFKLGSDKYKHELTKLEQACNNPTRELLKPEEQMPADKTFKKLFIQAVCVKALWAINKIREISKSTVPVIVLEEPMLAQLGNIKRDNEDITVEYVTSMLAKVVEKIQPTGALLAVQCFDKCDWKIPINAGIDIISFDAYNNPNNLCIIPDHIIDFLQRGGKINWGIIPTINESIVKNINLDLIEKRFINTLEGLVLAGVPRPLVYNSALVSVQGDVNELSLIFAEKALMLATQLSKRIPTVKKK